ncbi:MAG: hypothetical protein Q9192_007039, partial [Flavoplaca navasiana]
MLYEWAHDREPGIPHSSNVIKLASHLTSLVVPLGSTQELRAVIQLSALSESKQLESYLIARSLYMEDSQELMSARYAYSDFLYNYDWLATALEIMEPLSHTLSNNKHKARELGTSSEKVQHRLATMYLKMDRFSEAETMYGYVLPYSIGDETIPEPLSAHFLERQAWA